MIETLRKHVGADLLELETGHVLRNELLRSVGAEKGF